MSFTVTASEYELTAAKVAKLNKRAVKAGIPAVAVLTEISREERTEKTEYGLDRVYTVITAEITGTETAKFNGWSLAAVIDHDVAGNIFRSVPGFQVEVPAEFRLTAASRCDHCNAVRNRNQTILVWSETEGFKQVGSDCVKLFLGVGLNSLIAWIGELQEAEESDGGSWGASRGPTVREFVAAAALVTEVYGFKPASFEGQSTKRVAYDLITVTGQARTFFNKMNPELVNPDEKAVARANVLAAESVAWVASQSGSEYIMNLRIAAARDDVGANAGLLASLPNAYKRAFEAEVARAAKEVLPASEFVGTVGAKVTVNAQVVYTNRSAPFSYYGPEGLFVILLATDGSKFYVNTTVETAVGILFEDAERGTQFTVTGTVKEHKLTEKQEKVTVLTRCKAV